MLLGLLLLLLLLRNHGLERILLLLHWHMTHEGVVTATLHEGILAAHHHLLLHQLGLVLLLHRHLHLHHHRHLLLIRLVRLERLNVRNKSEQKVLRKLGALTLWAFLTAAGRSVKPLGCQPDC